MSPSERARHERQRGRGDRAELITSTGMRFTGSAVDLVADLPAAHATISLRPDDLLFAASFLVRPKSGRGDTVEVLLSVLNAALASVREQGEPLTRDREIRESQGRWDAVEWETQARGERWAGELTWVHPHPVVKGVSCTTHVGITERGQQVEMAVHVGAERGRAGVRGDVGAGQARPAFLDEMNRLLRLSFGGGAPPEPREVDAATVPSFVQTILLSARRDFPVAVLAPVETADPLAAAEYLVPPAQVAQELLGLAHLYVVDRHPSTFVLSDVLGDKRLSCFRGALRVYLPGFSRADDPMRHPLLIEGRVEDPVERAGLVGRLGTRAAGWIPVSAPVVELREAARTGERASGPGVEEATAEPGPVAGADTGAAAGAEGDGVEPLQVLPGALTEHPALATLARGLGEKLDHLVRLQEKLVDELARLRTVTAVRTANAASVERRLGQFERLLREHLRDLAEPEEARAPAEAGEPEDEEPEVTLVSVVQHAEAEYADALLILESAIESARESPYEDVARVAAILKAMAELARRRQEGTLGTTLREAFAELGIDYRGHIATSTSTRHRRQYLAALPDGTTVDCHEHLVLGSSYDPRYCLRIYFTSRAPGDPRFVVAHVGRHFDVMTTT